MSHFWLNALLTFWWMARESHVRLPSMVKGRSCFKKKVLLFEKKLNHWRQQNNTIFLNTRVWFKKHDFGKQPNIKNSIVMLRTTTISYNSCRDTFPSYANNNTIHSNKPSSKAFVSVQNNLLSTKVSLLDKKGCIYRGSLALWQTIKRKWVLSFSLLRHATLGSK